MVKKHSDITSVRSGNPLVRLNPKGLLFRNHRGLVLAVGYLMFLIIVSYVFYLRFPNNYTSPNFYAEDGQDFAKKIIEEGLLRSLGSTFNGYFIWGIYILHGIGSVVNHVLFNGEFVQLPRSIALTSYWFLGLVATLPILLFRKYLQPITLFFIVLLSIFVPLVGSDYAIIGTIGNFKFVFIYIAFLLLVYRHLMPASSKKVYIIDIALLICAYTNVTVYPMMFFALLRYISDRRDKGFMSRLLRDRTFQSLIILGAALLPQLYIIQKYGIPELTGYLDTPFNFTRTVEIFISRSYLYGLIFPVNKLLNDLIVVALFLTVLGVGAHYARKYRAIFLFGILSVFMATFLFVYKRTGISDSYLGYQSGGPDQFFYPQNLIFNFIFVITFTQLVEQIKKTNIRYAIYGLSAIIILICIMPQASTYGKNDFQAQDVGNIYKVSKLACETDPDNSIDVPSYPIKDLKYSNVPRSTLCTPSVRGYHDPVLSLGLKPYNNNYIAGLGSVNTVTQTFISPEDGLSGVGVYFSTFTETVKSPYSFALLDANCKEVIYRSDINTRKIKDNSIFPISFPKQERSANKSYCFEIKSDNKDDLLAVQLSRPGIYLDGVARQNNRILDSDLVFELNYSK